MFKLKTLKPFMNFSSFEVKLTSFSQAEIQFTYNQDAYEPTAKPKETKSPIVVQGVIKLANRVLCFYFFENKSAVIDIFECSVSSEY